MPGKGNLMGASPALMVEFAAILVDSRPRVRQEHEQKSQGGRGMGMGRGRRAQLRGGSLASAGPYTFGVAVEGSLVDLFVWGGMKWERSSLLLSTSTKSFDLLIGRERVKRQ